MSTLPMNSFSRSSLLRQTAAGACLLLLASPAWACDNKAAGFFDWDRCWSGSRLMIWALCLVPAWWFSFHVIFPGMLNYRKTDAAWPRDAFARCLALCWGLFWLAFLFLFAGISDELRRGGGRLFPAGWFGNLVNTHWPWAIIFLGVGLSTFLILWIFRSQESPQLGDE